MTTMLRLEVSRCLRSPAFLISIIASPIVTSLVLSRQLVGRSPNGSSVAAYFLISMATMGAIYAALMASGPWIAKERHAGWLRLFRVLPGNPVRYVIVKAMVGSVTGLLAIIGVLGVGGWLQKASFSAGSELRAGLAIWLGTLVFCAIGVSLGYLFDQKSINAPMLVLNWGFDILGGLLWPTERFPHWLRGVAMATPTFHIGDIAHRAQIGVGPSVANVAVLTGYGVAAVLAVVVVYRRSLTRT